MNEGPTVQQLLAGGFGALLGPAMVLPLFTVCLAGLVFAPVRHRLGHAATALVLVVIFCTATTSRGLATNAGSGWLVSLSILLVLSWLVARREENAFPWLGLVSGLLLAALAIQWRPDAYGPLLGSLRGGWQEAPDTAGLLVYHFATALALGGAYLVASEVGRKLPPRWGIGMWWAFSVGAGALMWTGTWTDLVQQLLLRWPSLPIG